MNYVLTFGADGADSHRLVGGKGANLARMAGAGFTVPPGCTVLTNAYQDFISGNTLDRAIAEILPRIRYDDFETVEKESRRIRELLESAPMPPAIADEITAAYRSLSAVGEFVAVRSSGTAEDLAEASFAGQHDTILDVRGELDLLAAVQACWASLWTARATAYRAQKGFDHGEVALAVVIQVMVRSDVSGVLFTANPMTASTDEIVINASWGLGEGIVSGILNPDQFVLDRHTLEVKDRLIGGKEVEVVRNPSGKGTVTVPVEGARADSACLTDDEVKRLAALGRDVAAYYEDIPQDIEWALADGEFYLLQSRDVTGVEFSWDSDILAWNQLQPPLPDDTIWSRKWADYGYTGKKTPLGVSTRDEMGTHMHMAAERLWGFEDVAQLRMFKYHRGEVYYNCRIDYLNQAHQLPPALRRPELQELAPKSWGQEIMKEPFSWANFLKIFARIKLIDPEHGPFRIWKTVYDQIESPESAKAGNGLPLEQLRQLSDQELLRYLDSRLMFQKEYLEDLWTIFYLYMPMVVAAHSKMIESWYKGTNPAIFADLITGLPNPTVTVKENIELWHLAERIRTSPQLMALFEAHQGKAFFTALEDAGDEGREFLDRYAEFLENYGWRGQADRDLWHPRRVEDPGIDYNNFTALLTAESAEPEPVNLELVRRREAAEQDVIDQIRKQPLAGPKVEAFKFVQAWMVRFWAMRDDERHHLDRNQFSKKQAVTEINRRLVARGILEGDDIYFLSKYEACDLLAGKPATRLTAAKIAARRRDFDRLYDEWDPPMFLRGGTPVDLDGTQEQGGVDGVYTGLGTSRGETTGIARIVPTQQDIGRVRKGDIMITSATDPGWTSVFLVISGLVLENGGMLAHGSCISREYGIPAVQLAGAKKLIKDGSTIAVNGDTGQIRILAEPDDDAHGEPAEQAEPREHVG